MKYYLPVILICLLFCSCAKSQGDVLKEISGVWRAKKDGAMVTINYGEKNTVFAIGDTLTPVTVGAVDKTGRSVDLNVVLAAGKQKIWKLKQVLNDKKTTDHLVLIMHDGTQDELTFVRKISLSDLNRFGISDSSAK